MSAIARAESVRAGAARDGDVAVRIVARLHRELGKLIGPAGFDVLLARALVLARRDHAALEAISVAPGGILTGTDGEARDGAALQRGTLAIVSQFPGAAGRARRRSSRARSGS